MAVRRKKRKRKASRSKTVTKARLQSIMRSEYRKGSIHETISDFAARLYTKL